LLLGTLLLLRVPLLLLDALLLLLCVSALLLLLPLLGALLLLLRVPLLLLHALLLLCVSALLLLLLLLGTLLLLLRVPLLLLDALLLLLRVSALLLLLLVLGALLLLGAAVLLLLLLLGALLLRVPVLLLLCRPLLLGLRLLCGLRLVGLGLLVRLAAASLLLLLLAAVLLVLRVRKSRGSEKQGQDTDADNGDSFHGVPSWPIHENARCVPTAGGRGRGLGHRIGGARSHSLRATHARQHVCDESVGTRRRRSQSLTRLTFECRGLLRRRRPAITMCTNEHASRQREPTLAGDRSEIAMLSTLIVVLVVLWAVGLATSYTLGGLIHILLAVAIIAVLLRVIQGRNPLAG
jgi:hypothetical protein